MTSAETRVAFLYFPQWQGSGQTDEIKRSAEIVHSHLGDVPFQKVSLSAPTLTIHGICGFESILMQLIEARNIISAANPQRLFTLGGDCGVELAPVSHLNRVLDGQLGVLWFDAHADLNTPASSPSGHFHGMPLRALLGDGEATIRGQLSSALTPGQITLIGCRDLDVPEQEYLDRNPITRIRANDFESVIEGVQNNLAKHGHSRVYLHLDMDVIDPDDFPLVKCPTKGGIRYPDLLNLVSTIHKRFEVVGGSVLEHCLDDSSEPERVSQVIELWRALAGCR